MDAGSQPKRRRKDRSRPDPPAQLKAKQPEAEAFCESLPLMPGVVMEDRRETWEFRAPHNDKTLWELQLIQAFGTRSMSLLNVFLEQLASLCPEVWDEQANKWKYNEREWNALIALVADHQPENSTQAAQAAQMAATHLMVMRLSAQALNNLGSVGREDAALASKLARTFTMQCEAMQALKGKSRTAKQSIHVTKELHQHVHYHEERGDGEPGEQSLGRGGAAQIIDTREAMRSEDAGGDALPRPSREGEEPVPLPRGQSRSPQGRAKR
jgi:hypothetical protein